VAYENKVQKKGGGRKKQSFSLVPLVLYRWKLIGSNFCFHAEKKKPTNKPAWICKHAFPSCLNRQPKVPVTSFLTGSHLKHAAKKCKQDSSVLGTTRWKSPKAALSSDTFLDRVLKPRWTVSFDYWKCLGLPFPCHHSLLLSFREKHSWWENRTVFVMRFTALLLSTTLKLQLMSCRLNWNWKSRLLQSNAGPSILSQGVGCT